MKIYNQKSEILYDLINNKNGNTEQDFRFIHGYRDIISILINRYCIVIKNKDIKFKNAYGKKSWYRIHYLERKDLRFAKEVLKKINVK